MAVIGANSVSFFYIFQQPFSLSLTQEVDLSVSAYLREMQSRILARTAAQLLLASHLKLREAGNGQRERALNDACILRHFLGEPLTCQSSGVPNTTTTNAQTCLLLQTSLDVCNFTRSTIWVFYNRECSGYGILYCDILQLRKLLPLIRRNVLPSSRFACSSETRHAVTNLRTRFENFLLFYMSVKLCLLP